VANTVYLYVPQIARLDRGRPWVKLGRGGLAELVSAHGHPPRPKPKVIKPMPTEPKIAQPPFAVLAKLLAEAREVQELGPATVDGQPVTRFLAILDPAQLKSEPLATGARLSAPPKPPTVTLEVALTESGLPIHILITAHDPGFTTTGSVDVPAVNFPLAIDAPPAGQTISIAQLRKLEKRAGKSRKQKRRSSSPSRLRVDTTHGQL
jgi:hypothetical protein